PEKVVDRESDRTKGGGRSCDAVEDSPVDDMLLWWFWFVMMKMVVVLEEER
ncbi:hypothetical protein A2U01_0082855, partial [Trifolium medium]|nr:hypothetical protein [Trifolium medium]